jgi:hypothetical protein
MKKSIMALSAALFGDSVCSESSFEEYTLDNGACSYSN